MDEEGGVQVGDVKLSVSTVLTTKYGSVRKRYSTYWNTQSSLSGSQLGFNGNMEKLENYCLAYGFDKLDTLVNPGKDSNFVTIGGISTGATLSGGATNYLAVAKKAYDIAVASRTDLA